MTAAELIEILQKVPADTSVMVSAPVTGTIPLEEEMIQDWTTSIVFFVE